MIKTKQELLNHFSDINEMYNNPFTYQTLSNMIDELLEQVKKEAYIQGYDYGVKDWFKSKTQPCEDAISREDAINVAIDAVDEWDGGCNTSRATIICKAIKKLPSVTPSYNSIKTELEQQTKWIPVSERLPKDGQKVLVTLQSDNIIDLDVDTVRYCHASAFWKHYVIAWMPLPEPYRESEAQ